MVIDCPWVAGRFERPIEAFARMWIIWPFRKKNFGSAWTICAEFQRFIEDDIGKYLIRDETSLPHPKPSIFESICIILITETNQDLLDSAELCAFELAFFQEGVGARPLHPLGIDLDAADQKTQVADRAGKLDYDRFKRRRDADWDKIKAVMDKLQRHQT